LDQVSFDAYGNKASETAPANGDRYGYTGREWYAVAGLQYNRARYYDPKAGGWISQDPIGFAAGDVNLYRYVSDCPVSMTDPTGWNVQVVDRPFAINVRLLPDVKMKLLQWNGIPITATYNPANRTSRLTFLPYGKAGMLNAVMPASVTGQNNPGVLLYYEGQEADNVFWSQQLFLTAEIKPLAPLGGRVSWYDLAYEEPTTKTTSIKASDPNSPIWAYDPPLPIGGGFYFPEGMGGNDQAPGGPEASWMFDSPTGPEGVVAKEETMWEKAMPAVNFNVIVVAHFKSEALYMGMQDVGMVTWIASSTGAVRAGVLGVPTKTAMSITDVEGVPGYVHTTDGGPLTVT
jgi:RHS repeat-associated protein